MDLRGKVAVVTGGAGGIGRALCHRFAQEDAAAVVVADVDSKGAEAVAAELAGSGANAVSVGTDVTKEAELTSLVETVEARHGRIDLFCSNAGVAGTGGVEEPDSEWNRMWELHVMAHVRAARHVLPGMVARGGGYLLQTASAAGLLTNMGAAPYTVTKHATVALAEWLAITYGHLGVKVSCLCPQGVNTAMLAGTTGPARTDNPGPPRIGAETGLAAVKAAGRVLEPDEVAEAVVAGLAEERFLILPHPEVARYYQRRAADPDRWLDAMRDMLARIEGAKGTVQGS